MKTAEIHRIKDELECIIGEGMVNAEEIDITRDKIFDKFIKPLLSLNENREQYAKEQAIKFARHISRDWYKLDVNKYIMNYSASGNLHRDSKTIEEIYDQWKTSQTQK